MPMVPQALQVHQQLFLIQCIAPHIYHDTSVPKLNTGKTVWRDLNAKDNSFGYSGLLYSALKPAECQIHAQIIQTK